MPYLQPLKSCALESRILVFMVLQPGGKNETEYDEFNRNCDKECKI